MMRLSQPNTKYFDFFKAHTTAKHSPSIGAYLDSAGDVYLDEQNTRTQPPGQHTGVISEQPQVFCRRQNPTPDFDQSVAK